MHRVLEGIVSNERIAAAYLLVGPPGSNKETDASLFADRLGCGKADKFFVKPDGASLKIEQIRELQQTVRYGPAYGPYLFAIIEKADTLTPEAAGAFLKTLEEPPAGVVFVLLVEREDLLPATILSRCQKIIFEEALGEWQPKAEWENFYAELKNLKRKSILELFDFSAKMEKEKERIEELLYDLVFFAKQELRDLRVVRILLEAAKNLKRKANFKLTLDVACLKLGEACQTI